MREVDVGKLGKGYFEDQCNIDTVERAAVKIYGFDGVRRGD